MFTFRRVAAALAVLFLAGTAQAAYVNFESSQVHPITLNPAGDKLLVINTPDARLEVFVLAPDGSLTKDSSIPVGLEPVSVASRLNAATGNEEAWVVNHLSDSVSVVDLSLRRVVRTLPVGDEPTDIVFASGKAFVSVSQEDLVRVVSLPLPALPALPVLASVPLFGRAPRALAVGGGGAKVYAVLERSGNQTTIVDGNVAFGNDPNLNLSRLSTLGLNTVACGGLCAGGPTPGDSCTADSQCGAGGTCPGSVPPPYPPLPPGIARNPALIDPPDGVPKVGLIVQFNNAVGKWLDETGKDWSPCLPFRLPDHDLFIIDAANPATVPVATVDHLGTTLFEVSVHPVNGRIYIPNTDARNFVRFEHPLGVQGHVVDNLLAVVDPGAGNSVTRIDLNTHINRSSDPAANLVERQASISQPGMMAWKADGSTAYLTAIGSRKLFRLDGSCLSGGCIFGPNRAAPAAVVVGEGPTGVALSEPSNRAYVLLRFSNSVALVDTLTMQKTGEVSLHDPTPQAARDGRRFLYDGIDTSGHGDAACSSCHISGDMDSLAWDLGDPEGTMAPYSAAGDNVRFILPIGGNPVNCNPNILPLCAAHNGFDPQKGPMTTQTLRAMLEPLHWRGDRPTMRQFNKAFVGLMGTADIGPVNGEPAGLTAAQMDLYRTFALAIRMPPNPFRNVDDTLPDTLVQPRGSPFAGNPASGENLFTNGSTDGGQPCKACHASQFGAAGGQLGGVEPTQPTSPQATALFNGNADQSQHSDLEVPHLRNMYVKFGPRYGAPGTTTPPESKTGFGFVHDGAIPDLGTFLSINVFNLTPAQVRDIATFMFYFSTGTRPSVGKQVTLPAGTPPTGLPGDENLLATLIALGNGADALRHCELVATAPAAGRVRSYSLSGGISTGGLWNTDVAGEPQVTTSQLRSGASGAVTFLCVPLGEGGRLGVDLDEDLRRNGDDCAADDPGAWAPATEALHVAVTVDSPAHLVWDDQASATGPGVVYDVVGGSLLALRASGLASSTGCLSGDLSVSAYDDARPDPPIGDGYYYLARSRNICADGGFGPGRTGLDTLTCAP